MKIVCDFSFFYLDKVDPKGTLLVETGKMLEKNGYVIKSLNTINFKKSTACRDTRSCIVAKTSYKLRQIRKKTFQLRCIIKH